MKKIASMLLVATVLTGCATQQKSVAKFEGASEYQYSFKQDEISKKPVTQGDIIGAIVNALNSGTKFQFYQRWNGNFYDFSGMYIKTSNQQGIAVSYSRGGNFGNSESQFRRSEHQYVTTFNIGVTANQTDNSATNAAASISPDVVVSNGSSPIGKSYEPIGTVSQFSSELNRILSNKGTISVKRYAPVEGEVNVSFNTDSIYANFLRKLGKYNYRQNEVKSNDIEKVNSYSYKYGNETVPLRVSVLPYRNGSKVTYSMSVPYAISADGRVSLTLADIADIKKNIEKIAND